MLSHQSGDADRFTTMSLATPGPCTVSGRGNPLAASATRPVNYVADIAGAQPLRHSHRYQNKPTFYEPGDIRGAVPMPLHRQSNAPDNTLNVSDIDGAVPKPYAFKTKRCVNPLVPDYPLPASQPAPPPTQRFLRDSMQVADIQGTRPQPLFKFPMRDNHTVADIEGAQAGWRRPHEVARLAGPPLDHALNVKDINNVGFKTKRTGCPLQPEYLINGMVIKDDKYSKPRPLPAPASHPYYTLTTNDIDGAYPGWTPPHGCQPPLEKRRHFRNTNFVGDIAGAQPDTVKHAIRTNRVVNPLNPTYDSLDGEVLRPPLSPNLLNGDPAALEGKPLAPETMEMATAHLSARQPVEKEPVFVPPVNLDRARGGDEKDRLIEQLESELAALKSSSLSSTSPAPFPGSGRLAPAQQSGRSAQPVATAAPSARDAEAKGGGGPADGKAMLVSSGRRPSRAHSTGKSVVAQPSARREAKSLADDIAAVRAL